MALTFLPAPLLAMFGDGAGAPSLARWLGPDGAGVPADAAILSGLAAMGSGAACDRGRLHAIHCSNPPTAMRAGRAAAGRGAFKPTHHVNDLDAAQLRSGKGSGDENFPVASWLVAPRHRRPILAFYEFVRIADDIADHPKLERGREARASRSAWKRACSAATITTRPGSRCARRWRSATCRRSTRRTCSGRSARTSPSIATRTGTI